MKIPNFVLNQHDRDIIDRIRNKEWEVRKGRVLFVKGSNIALLWASTSERTKLETYARLHNENLLLGMTDEEYNKTVEST